MVGEFHSDFCGVRGKIMEGVSTQSAPIDGPNAEVFW